jgi:hypothetical protein
MRYYLKLKAVPYGNKYKVTFADRLWLVNQDGSVECELSQEGGDMKKYYDQRSENHRQQIGWGRILGESHDNRYIQMGAPGPDALQIWDIGYVDQPAPCEEKATDPYLAGLQYALRLATMHGPIEAAGIVCQIESAIQQREYQLAGYTQAA